MMRTFLMFFILSCTPYFSSAVTELTPMDIERLTGFAEHKKSERDFDIERNTGYKEWLQGQEDWDRAQKKAAEEFRKLAKEPSPSEDIRAYKDWLDEQEEWNQEQEQARKSFIADRKHLKRPLTEEEELEIYSKRPRYRLKGRTLYNSRATRSRPTGPTQPAHREEPPETAPFTPPPPTPTPPSGDFDFPPPPPPPMDDDFPPPPPPPSFDDFDSDFPPPPPPPPSDFVPDM